jgi:hypothetical protein
LTPSTSTSTSRSPGRSRRHPHSGRMASSPPAWARSRRLGSRRTIRPLEPLDGVRPEHDTEHVPQRSSLAHPLQALSPTSSRTLPDAITRKPLWYRSCRESCGYGDHVRQHPRPRALHLDRRGRGPARQACATGCQAMPPRARPSTGRHTSPNPRLDAGLLRPPIGSRPEVRPDGEGLPDRRRRLHGLGR